tara:strand:- start:654 stop:827 length:174 start_codon:yes stop_codon:yes gene_type:complete
MINIDYLKLGQLNTNTMFKNTIKIKSKKNNTKLEYYRLSSGFKDANNTYKKYCKFTC